MAVPPGSWRLREDLGNREQAELFHPAPDSRFRNSQHRRHLARPAAAAFPGLGDLLTAQVHRLASAGKGVEQEVEGWTRDAELAGRRPRLPAVGRERREQLLFRDV